MEIICAVEWWKIIEAYTIYMATKYINIVIIIGHQLQEKIIFFKKFIKFTPHFFIRVLNNFSEKGVWYLFLMFWLKLSLTCVRCEWSPCHRQTETCCIFTTRTPVQNTALQSTGHGAAVQAVVAIIFCRIIIGISKRHHQSLPSEYCITSEHLRQKRC